MSRSFRQRARRRGASLLITMGLLSWLWDTSAEGQQVVDPNFDTSVRKPAYRGNGPLIVIDEAHQNASTANDRYQPLADLLRHDGYRVEAGTSQFTAASLAPIAVLVIANAGSRTGADTTQPAFTDAECDAVRDWVRGGGALLLIADHAPYGAAAQGLAARFGVTLGNGWVYDRGGSFGITTQLPFSQEQGSLGDHAILRGRDPSEAIAHVVSFSGQSMSVPAGAIPLLKLSATMGEAATRAELDAAAEVAKKAAGTNGSATHAPPDKAADKAPNKAQGIALTFGKGRVVMVGEAAMFSAQVVTLGEGAEKRVLKAGMNTDGNDDRQFALNVLHWLSGVLQ